MLYKTRKNAFVIFYIIGLVILTYLHPSDRVDEFCISCLGRIREEKLSPTPENYELWYVYYSGADPEVKRVLDAFSLSGKAFTNETCYELYQKLLRGNREDEKVRSAGDQIKKTIEDVNQAVGSVREFASEYNLTLEDVNSKLREEKTKEEIHNILGEVLADTKTMLDQNNHLEALLKESADTMEKLHRDLEIARKEALTDSLTGLANRKAFDQEIKKVAQLASQPDHEPFCVLLLDIDHFKGFNDTFGHQVGDQVLRLVARALKQSVKGRDIAARYGGEEFAIILPETRLQGAQRVGEMLRQDVAKKEVINRNTGERLARITLSVGVAEYFGSEQIENLISRADSALYAAKHNGRNQVAVAPIAMTPGSQKDRKTSV